MMLIGSLIAVFGFVIGVVRLFTPRDPFGLGNHKSFMDGVNTNRKFGNKK